MSKQTTPNQNIALGRANHAGIAVRDLDRSIAFYQALTGQEPVVIDHVGGTGIGRAAGLGRCTIRYATFKLQNLNIDLLEFEEPTMKDADYQANDAGAMHLCFEVDDVYAVYERMRKAGIQFHGNPYTFREEDGPSKSTGAGTTVAYFDDPDGTHLELIAPTGPFIRKEAEHTTAIS